MYYETLFKKYSKDARILKAHIKKLKKQYDGCHAHNQNELYYRITLLYSMYLDLTHASRYLLRKCEVSKNEE